MYLFLSALHHGCEWPASSSCLDFPSFGQMNPFLAKLFVFRVFFNVATATKLEHEISMIAGGLVQMGRYELYLSHGFVIYSQFWINQQSPAFQCVTLSLTNIKQANVNGKKSAPENC